MANLANYFSENGYDTILVTSFRSAWEYPLASTVKRLTLEEQEIKQSKIKRNISRIKKLRNLCKRERPDVLVSFMQEPNFRAILATRGLNVKTLVSVRSDPNKEYEGIVGTIVGKWILPMADGCVFQTLDAQKCFPRRLQKKSKIIYNTVKEEFFEVIREPTRGEIVTCGRLTEAKNHAMLIDTFADVVKQIPYATLKIYGEGSLRGTLQKQINNLGLQEKIKLMGLIENVADALKTADLFILSSDYEGMPNALMEAMAAGVPCISTDCPCGGPRELFGAELSAQLVQVGSKEELSTRTIQYFQSSNWTKKTLATAEKTVSQKFKSEIIYNEWIAYIISLMHT